MATAASYGSLSFEQQLNYMRQKMPSVNYDSVVREAHDTAFVVAGANRIDLVTDIHQVLQRSMREGSTIESFREDFYAVLDNYGWQPDGGREWRSRVIYETNLRASYAAGRYAQLQSLKHVRPYWMFEHSDAVITPRLLHVTWNGLVIHCDDAWWLTHYPPNGWGCQCKVRALNLRDLQRLGKTAPDTPPPNEMVTVFYKGQQIQVPKGIDPGWNYAPGRSKFAQQIQNTLEKAENLPARPAASINNQLLANEAVSNAVSQDWKQFIDTVLKDDVPRNRKLVIGSLTTSQVDAMQAYGVTTQTAAIDITDKTLLHIMRQTKAAKITAAGQAIALDKVTLEQIPKMLASPQAVLLDKTSQALIYVYPHPEREAVKLVVKVNFAEKIKVADGTRQTLMTNHLRTATLINQVDIKKDIRKKGEPDRLNILELLEGKL